jgi:putative NIF3 family GTP cyclohydrolase 1 type 2
MGGWLTGKEKTSGGSYKKKIIGVGGLPVQGANAVTKVTRIKRKNQTGLTASTFFVDMNGLLANSTGRCLLSTNHSGPASFNNAMNNITLSLADISDFLRNELAVDRYPADEQGGVYRPSSRPIARLGLALEPFAGLADWVEREQLDALWLHRPWQLSADTLPPDMGVLYHHLPFDETLTIGYCEPLASQLDATSDLEPIGYKQAVTKTGEPLPKRAIGMLLDINGQEFDECLDHVKDLLGNYDRAEAGRQLDVDRIAVVGAMTDELVREAAERGANVYLTGQYRKPAQDAVNETGMAVIAVGHRRSETWGLRALAELLRTKWPDLTVLVHA